MKVLRIIVKSFENKETYYIQKLSSSNQQIYSYLMDRKSTSRFIVLSDLCSETGEPIKGLQFIALSIDNIYSIEIYDDNAIDELFL